MEQKSHQIQTAAYEMLWNETFGKKYKIKRRYTLKLTKAGFKLIPHKLKSDIYTFQACVNVYKYKQKGTK